MIERILTYPPAHQALYLQGVLYSRWKRKYGHAAIFLECRAIEATTKLIPVKCPPLKTQTFGFGEFFASIHYIDIGYNVSYDYWGKRWRSPSYFKVVEILGPEAAGIICQSHPQPPDLFVFDKKGRFFFVEVKLPTDRHKEKQEAFCRRIERYLNKNMLQSKRQPHLPKGHWIELLRLIPEFKHSVAT